MPAHWVARRMRGGSFPPWRLQDTARLRRSRPSLPGTGFSQASATAAGGNDLENPLQTVRPPESRLALGTPVFFATARTARPLAPVFPGLSGAALPAGSPPTPHISTGDLRRLWPRRHEETPGLTPAADGAARNGRGFLASSVAETPELQ